MIPVLLAGGSLGAVLGILYAYNDQVRSTVDTAAKAVSDQYHRLPDPGFFVDLPDTVEDYEDLDAIVCQCAQDLAALQDDFPAYVTAVRDCTAEAIYPGLWPPVPGDHPTVPQLWNIITYEVSRRAREGRLCPDDIAGEMSNTLFSTPTGRFI